MRTPSTKIETISPAEATVMLGGNHQNRVVVKSHVESLAKAMKDGRWMATHQGIAISSGGRLLDGQHRLLAVVMSGVTVQMQVTRDADEETFKLMDINKTRKHHDRIHLVDDQILNKNICTYIAYYMRSVRGNRGQTDVDELENIFLEDTAGWIWIGNKFRTAKPGITVAGVAAALAGFRTAHASKAEEFVDVLLTGLGRTSSNDPIMRLREALLQKKLTHNDASTYWKTVRACEYFLNSRELVRLDSASEDFFGNEHMSLHEEFVKRGVRSHMTRKHAG